jgi:hypothetical protein
MRGNTLAQQVLAAQIKIGSGGYYYPNNWASEFLIMPITFHTVLTSYC